MINIKKIKDMIKDMIKEMIKETIKEMIKETMIDMIVKEEVDPKKDMTINIMNKKNLLMIVLRFLEGILN